VTYTPPGHRWDLATLDTNRYQADTGNKCESAEDGGDGERVLGFVRDLDRSEVDVLLLVGEGDASGGKSDNGQENEQSSDDGCWFHLMGMTFPASNVRVVRSDAYVVGSSCIDPLGLEPPEGLE
jgi:hypothetical protein